MEIRILALVTLVTVSVYSEQYSTVCLLMKSQPLLCIMSKSPILLNFLIL